MPGRHLPLSPDGLVIKPVCPRITMLLEDGSWDGHLALWQDLRVRCQRAWVSFPTPAPDSSFVLTLTQEATVTPELLTPPRKAWLPAQARPGCRTASRMNQQTGVLARAHAKHWSVIIFEAAIRQSVVL